MTHPELRYRQIHLDFHTSEAIEGIGAQFDAEEFVATLDRARVNSITCFARGHHGWIYFDTQRFPERRHPHLKCNLLKEQIDACHARNIRVPIYVTVQWDHLTAHQHPDWLCLDPSGKIQGTAPFDAGFYRKLCLNTPYVDFLKEHVEEILQTLPCDGFFFDIMQPNDCCCAYCRDGMKAQGLEPADADARQQYGLQVIRTFEREMTELVQQHAPEATLFYNAGHIGPRHRDEADYYTHWELESLPSGGWGYLHFPVTQRYAHTLGKDCLAMTGKFHTSWGDFHSFKNPAALQFECFRALALNAKCSIGDQLPPLGKICQATYELIGSVYSEVEQKEPWCRGAKVLSDIGVMTPEEFTGGRTPEPAGGAVLMLQEGGYQFDMIDSATDLSNYKGVILPDVIPVADELAAKLGQYVAGGGALIASHQSGLNPEKTEFALPALGVRLKGEAPYSPDFLVPKGEVGKGLPETEHVMYLKGTEVEPAPGSEVLVGTVVPYFNRTYKHFCSHAHTPSAGEVGYPGIVRNGNAIYFAHPLFTQYQANAPKWCKTLLHNALDLLLPDPLLRHDGPSTVLATINEQPAESRQVVHLLHYLPERRGKAFDVIEDVIPLYDLRVSVRAPRAVTAVTCVPEGGVLAFEAKDGRVEFVLPKLMGHQMIAVELG